MCFLSPLLFNIVFEVVSNEIRCEKFLLLWFFWSQELKPQHTEGEEVEVPSCLLLAPHLCSNSKATWTSVNSGAANRAAMWECLCAGAGVTERKIWLKFYSPLTKGFSPFSKPTASVSHVTQESMLLHPDRCDGPGLPAELLGHYNSILQSLCFIRTLFSNLSQSFKKADASQVVLPWLRVLRSWLETCKPCSFPGSELCSSHHNSHSVGG